jgi:hypothetical protein
MNVKETHKMKQSIVGSETIVIMLQCARRKQDAEDKAAICGFLNWIINLQSRARV